VDPQCFNADPDPTFWIQFRIQGFDDPKMKKISAEKKFDIF